MREGVKERERERERERESVCVCVSAEADRTSEALQPCWARQLPHTCSHKIGRSFLWVSL